jgi:hypothetical protein
LNKIDLLLDEKRAELKTLDNEMYEALRYPGDRDYGYAALLYPLIGGLQREIRKLETLARLSEPPVEERFEARVWHLLTGQSQSLEMWVSIRDYHVPQTTFLLEIRKLKAKHTLSCTLLFAKCFEQYVFYDSAAPFLEQIGWHKMRGGRMFKRKAVVKNLNDLEKFCQWMSATMLEGFDGVWKYSDGQYYRFKRE